MQQIYEILSFFCSLLGPLLPFAFLFLLLAAIRADKPYTLPGAGAGMVLAVMYSPIAVIINSIPSSEATPTMLERIYLFLSRVCWVVNPIAIFVFVFFLISSIRAAVKGERYIALGVAAGVALMFLFVPVIYACINQ